VKTALQWTQRVLLTFGVIAICYSVGTEVYSKLYQYHASSKFDQTIALRDTAKSVPVSSGPAAPPLAEGDPIGKLEIERLGISVIVLQGVETDTLKLGAGHVPETSMPSDDGNIAIAAHRDTFFRPLEGLKDNDRIRISTLHGVYEYEVNSTEIVDPEDVGVLESKDYPELTLITCYPFHYIGSAPNRFIVHARRVSAVAE
jgi:sortase A